VSAVDPKKVYKNLTKKGFVESTKQNPDHKYLELFVENRLVVHTKLSHSNKDICEGLIRQMSIQCGLTKQQFLELVSCPMSQEKYLEILKDQGRF